MKTDNGIRDVLYVVCDGKCIGGRFRFRGDQQWKVYEPGYRISGGLDDGGCYDDLVVERSPNMKGEQ